MKKKKRDGKRLCDFAEAYTEKQIFNETLVHAGTHALTWPSITTFNLLQYLAC